MNANDNIKKENIMTTFDLGFISTNEQAKKIKDAVDGKTYMNFRVDCGISPSGPNVTISTDYDDSEKEITEFLMNLLAESI